MQTIETPRLTLRYLTPSDADFIFALLNMEDWKKYIGDRKIHTVDHARAYIQTTYMPHYDQNGFGNFGVELKETGQLIGTCGIFKRDGLDHVDVGFAFLPGYAGKGYAFEAASQLLDVAKNTYNITTVQGITVPYNKRSIALLERLGLQFVKHLMLPGDDEVLMLFERTL
ncbi:RimJ/RimL family protein N-acetyltransferase [Chitinophaga skermanii]|uniref:RimJ/RimL family protein N-acetyltransferase n=1 Tax=Chitinophaga skermanii TaxID=331697 RepID=A0A327QTR5_9BACT|nr:GNAT family N-acetyltransferase [Chitinophaga skermanii]RAJ05137.1 RimJ/RimL family protein N-acetyltransferase [Chitinophaga skermanii]